MKKFTYPDYREPCGWNALLPPRSVSPSLNADSVSDVVVIGAGYTGVAAARRWAALRPNADVALIDASEIGEGNAGRNSGFLLEVALANDFDPAQPKRMQACNRLIASTMKDMVSDVHASRIQCDLRRTGTFRAAAGRDGIQALRGYRRFLDSAGLPSETLSGGELMARTGTNFYREALFSPHCYLAQPAALIRALVHHLPSSVRRYENTPAIELRRSKGQWQVTTPGGTLRAPRVVVANNAFCKNLGIGGSHVVAMYTYAAITSPLPVSRLQHCGSDAEWGLLPAHRLGSTLRRTADGRLLIRSFYGYEKESGRGGIEVRLRTLLLRRFPGLGSVPFAAVWAGATGFTMNGAPLWGELEPGLFVSAGCNGGGVVKGTLFGGLLAELGCGSEVPDIEGLFGRASWMPPEPLRALGFRVISSIEKYRGRAEV